MSTENYNRIDNAKYLFLTQITEPDENVLEFEVSLGEISKNDQEVKIGNSTIGPVREVRINEEQNFRIVFNSYISYTVINESYAAPDNDKYDGKSIRVYKNSRFLKYINADTIATPEYPGTFKHYSFLCENHIINIATQSEPEIIKTTHNKK